MELAEYTIPAHISGDTFVGVHFTLENQDGPIVLTGALIEIILDNRGQINDVVTRRGTRVLSTATGGIAITNAILGQFSVVSQLINWEPQTYTGILRVTLPAKIKTYAAINWNIL